MAGRGPKRLLSLQIEQDIVRRAEAGETHSAIAETLGIGKSTVTRTLRRQGVEPSRAVVSPEDEIKIVEMHLSGLTLDQVAEQFGLNKARVWNIAKANGASKGRGAGRRRGYSLHEGAFDTITEESAYWIGFLFGDGCIHQDDQGSAAIEINLAEKDRKHLEKFRDFLGSNHAITTIKAAVDKKIKSGQGVYFKVRSKLLTDALRRYGMTAKNEDRCPTVDELKNSRDFWRGVVDADGSVGDSHPRYAAFSLCGHMALLLGFQKWLEHERLSALRITECTDNKNQAVPRQNPLYRVGSLGSKAYKIIHRLYNEAAVALDRKLVTAKNIIESRY